MLNNIGRWLAEYLQKELKGYQPSAPTNVEKLRKNLQPGDILLVEGNTRVSVAIKYLTQSTWSHAAFYVGKDKLDQDEADSADPVCFVEANLSEGVVAKPLSEYTPLSLRIARPIGLTAEDREQIISYIVDRIGYEYDLKNIIDLARYLLPVPPVPVRWRRRMLALGSGDPTKAICSTLLAETFQTIRYPILPEIEEIEECDESADKECLKNEIMHIRHHSLFVPRDFDLSPYFEIIKPTVESSFDYKGLRWNEQDKKTADKEKAT